MIPITARIQIDESELRFSYVRSSGPGGQNVNKVATAVQLQFDVANSPSLPAAVRKRLMALAGKRLSSEGVLQIQANRHRTQESNRREAVNRLVELIQRAAVPPRPRVPTRPTAGSKQRRLDDKQKRSETKERRSRKPGEDS